MIFRRLNKALNLSCHHSDAVHETNIACWAQMNRGRCCLEYLVVTVIASDQMKRNDCALLLKQIMGTLEGRERNTTSQCFLIAIDLLSCLPFGEHH